VKAEIVPMAAGHLQGAEGPFSIRVTDAGNAFLHVVGTGMAFTCCLTADQLRELADMAAWAAAEIRAGREIGEDANGNFASIFNGNVVSIFRNRA
jgi:hypothetical protein